MEPEALEQPSKVSMGRRKSSKSSKSSKATPTPVPRSGDSWVMQDLSNNDFIEIDSGHMPSPVLMNVPHTTIQEMTEREGHEKSQAENGGEEGAGAEKSPSAGSISTMSYIPELNQSVIENASVHLSNTSVSRLRTMFKTFCLCSAGGPIEHASQVPSPSQSKKASQTDATGGQADNAENAETPFPEKQITRASATSRNIYAHYQREVQPEL